MNAEENQSRNNGLPQENLNDGLSQEESDAGSNEREDESGNEEHERLSDEPSSGSKNESDGCDDQEKMRAGSMLHRLLNYGLSSERNQKQIMSILQENPHFAAYRYKYYGQMKYPLRILVCIRTASLETIRSVYEMYPDAISERKYEFDQGKTVLHEAIEALAPAGTIEFLIDNYPEAAMLRDDLVRLPIDVAIANCYGPFRDSSVSFSVIKKLLDLNPEAICPKLVTESILFGLGLEIVQLLIERKPNKNVFSHLEFNEIFRITPDVAEAIALLLPHVKHFTCCPSEWTAEGVTRVLRAIDQCKATLRSVAFAFPEALLGSTDGNLLQFLKGNSAIENACFICGSPYRMHHVEAFHRMREVTDDEFLSILAPCLEDNRSLKVLELRCFHFVHETRLMEFLLSGLTPACLQLTYCQFRGTLDQVFDYSDCKIEELIIRDSFLGSSFPDHVINYPRLTNLTATNMDPELDIPYIMLTDPLIALLQQNKISTFHIGEGYGIDPGPFLDALRINTSLDSLILEDDAVCFEIIEPEADIQGLVEILKFHNLSLKCIQLERGYCSKHEEKEQEVRYYGLLNKFGRGRIRRPSTSSRDFVHLLSQVEVADTFSEGRNDKMKASVLYGLLREIPSLLNDAAVGIEVSTSIKEPEWKKRKMHF